MQLKIDEVDLTRMIKEYVNHLGISTDDKKIKVKFISGRKHPSYAVVTILEKEDTFVSSTPDVKELSEVATEEEIAQDKAIITDTVAAKPTMQEEVALAEKIKNSIFSDEEVEVLGEAPTEVVELSEIEAKKAKKKTKKLFS